MRGVQFLGPLAALILPVGVGLAGAVSAAFTKPERAHLLKAATKWLVIFGPLLVLAVLTRDQAAWHFVILVVVATGIELLGQRLFPLVGWAVALAAILIFQAVEYRVNTITFAPADAAVTEIQRFYGAATGVQAVPKSSTPSTPWYRDWSVQTAGAAYAEISLEVRATGQAPTGGWYTRNAAVTPSGSTFEQLSFSTPDASVWRTYEAAEPLGGRTFLARGKVADPSLLPFAASSCDLVVLKIDVAPWISSCQSARLTDMENGEFEVSWTVPSSVSERRLRVEISATDSGLTGIELGHLVLYDATDGEDPASGVLPTQVVLRADVLGGTSGEYAVAGEEVSDSWTALTVSVPIIAGQNLVRTTLRVPSGVSVEVRSVALRTAGSVSAMPRPARQAAWFGHANTAAVVVVGAFLAAVSRQPRLVLLLGVLVAASMAIGLSGSRNGFVLLVLATVLTVVMRLWRNRLQSGRIVAVATAVSLIAITIIGSALSPRILEGAVDGNSVTRQQIWAAATDAITSKPLEGWGTSAAEALNSRLTDSGNVDHAHNWWLEQGVRYGVPGLLASLWTAALLLAVAWRRGAFVTAAALLLLASNLLDSTFLGVYPWVPLFCLLAVPPINSAKHSNSGLTTEGSRTNTTTTAR